MDKKKNNQTDSNETKGKPFDSLTKTAQEQSAEFGAAGHDDINKNLGSFGPTNTQQSNAAPDVKLDVDVKTVEKASKEKIDFERFKKTKRVEKAAKTRFGEKVSIMLGTKKGFTLTWILEITIMAIIIIISSIFIGILTKYKGCTGDGPVPLDEIQKPLKAGLVFAWISLFPCIIPLIYLVTTWFIGINGVARSRLYHFMFWIFGLIALICFVVGLGCLIGPMSAVNLYPPI